MRLYTIQTDAGCIVKFIKPTNKTVDTCDKKGYKFVIIDVPVITWLLFTIFDIEPKAKPCG